MKNLYLFIFSFNHKLKNEVAQLTELIEDVRGDVIESIKQRRRERADLVNLFIKTFLLQMNEMNHVAARIDKGKAEYDEVNSLV